MAEINIGNKLFIIPDEGSPCDLWRTYFAKLKKEVGKENAKMIWLLTWSENGSTSCTTNADFNKWLKKNDIDVTTAATRAVADISKIGGNILGMGKSMTKVVGISAIGIVIVILILLINTARKMDATDVATILPAGKAAKVAGLTNLLKRK